MVRHHQEWAPSQKPPLAPVNLSYPRVPRCLEGTKITEWKIPRAPTNPVLRQPLCAQRLSRLRVGGGEAVFDPAGAWQPHGVWNKGGGKQLACVQAQQHHCPCWIEKTPCNLHPHCALPLLWDAWSKPVPVPLGVKGVLWSPKFPIYTHFWPWFLIFQGCGFLARQPHGVVLSPKRCSPDPTAKEQQC